MLFSIACFLWSIFQLQGKLALFVSKVLLQKVSMNLYLSNFTQHQSSQCGSKQITSLWSDYDQRCIQFESCNCQCCWISWQMYRSTRCFNLLYSAWILKQHQSSCWMSLSCCYTTTLRKYSSYFSTRYIEIVVRWLTHFSFSACAYFLLNFG